jgi:hypothetical protein
MITLSAPPRLAHLRAFGVLLSLFYGAVVAMLAWVLRSDNPLLTWVMVTSVMVAVSVTTAHQLVWLYNRWNSLVRWLSRRTTTVISGICFCICAALPKNETRFEWKPRSPGASNWAKTGAAGSVPEPLRADPVDGRQHPRWARAYVRWAPQSGNGWAVVLLPFLALLSLFADDEEEPVPVQNYTLF